VEGFMANSVYGLPKTILDYGSVWLRIEITEQNFLEVSLTELAAMTMKWHMGYMERSIYDLCKVGFLFEPMWLKVRTTPLLVGQVFHIQFLKYIRGKIDGIHGKVHL
jgi:hypothetical protein